MNIERLHNFPPVSKLDPQIYGPQESALKEEHIVGHLNGMTVQEVKLILNKLENTFDINHRLVVQTR